MIFLLKPLQNKKGQKIWGTRENSSLFPYKRTAFFSGTPNFFGPSYFEAALKVTMNLCKFLIFKTKKTTSFLGWKLIFLILCYHARHLQQIYWNKFFCGMYGLAVMLSLATRRTSKNIDVLISVNVGTKQFALTTQQFLKTARWHIFQRKKNNCSSEWSHIKSVVSRGTLWSMYLRTASVASWGF